MRLTGTVKEYYNLTELDHLTHYEILSSGNAVPDPAVLSTGDVSQEQWEGGLARVENVSVSNEDLGYGEWSVSDGSGDVRIDDKGSYTYAPANGDAIDAIIGPLDYGYETFKIQPRDDGDITLPVHLPDVVINEIDADMTGYAARRGVPGRTEAGWRSAFGWSRGSEIHGGGLWWHTGLAWR